MKMKQVTELKDQDTKILSFIGAGEDGKEFTMMTIEYKRKK